MLNTQTKSKKSISNETSLIKILAEFGFNLADNEECFNVINIDPRLFQLKLKNFLKKNDSNITTEKFQTLLNTYLEKDLNFIISLLPTKVNSNVITSTSTNHSINQDSLIKILAEIDELQCGIFDHLLEKLTLYEDEKENEKQILNLTINVSTYILNQFRYQPKIMDSEYLCDRFTEILCLLSSVKIKKELINCLPDVIGDTQHDKLAINLEKLLSDADLISCTLETIKYFKFNDNEILLEIVKKLFSNFSLINANDLPVLIKFMLKSVISLNSNDLMDKLRKKINFDDLDLTENIKYLIFDALKEYFQISNKLITIYLDVLNTNLSITNRLQQIDLLILFIIYTMPQNAKLVDKVVKNLIKVNCGFNELLLKKVFVSCGTQIIQELFDTICQFAKPLILSTNPRLNIIASSLYKLGYEYLDRKYKQIVINIIVNHAISCVNIERDNALDILYDLATSEQEKKNTTTKLSQFAVIIKMLLDFIDYFSIQQTRKLYFIMCTLSYDESSIKSLTTTQNQQDSVSSASVIQDTLYIMITKQLSSSQIKYKQMGVMGVLMMLKCISHKLSVKKTSALLNTEIKNILQMIHDSSKNSPETMCLFYDYLNSLIRSNSLIKPIEDTMKDTLKEHVKTLFRVSDINHQPMQTQSNQILGKNLKLKYELIFGLDNVTNGALNLHKQILNEIYFKNYQYLSTNQHEQHNFISPVIIPSFFRLISSLERKNLDDLKSYLGIPISCVGELGDLCNISGKTAVNYENSLNNFINGYTEIEKKCFLDTIFYLINWFIELINAFTLCSNHMNSEEINEKILLRLNLIIKLKELLLVYLPAMPFYKPPIAVFGLDETNEVPFIHALLKKSKVPNSKKTTDKKSNKRKTTNDDDDDDDEDGNIIKKKKKIKKDSIDTTNVNNDMAVDAESSDSDMSVLNNSVSITDTKLAKLAGKNIEDEKEFFNKLSICFRELDINILNLLNLNLELNTADLSSISDSVMNNIYIKPKQLLFILNDINKKMEFLLLKTNDKLFEDEEEDLTSESNIPETPSATGGGLSSFLQQKSTKLHLYKELNSIKSTDLIDNLVMNNNLINSIFVHLGQIFEYLNNSKNESVLDANSKSGMLLKCLSQLFKLLLIIFKWFEKNAAEYSSVKTILKDFMFKLNKLSSNNTSMLGSNPDTQPDQTTDFQNILKYFSKFRKVINDLGTSHCLIEILDILFGKLFLRNNCENVEKLHSQIAGMSVEFLKKDFYKGTIDRKLNNESVYKILKIFDKNCPQKKSIDFCELINGIITDELFEESRDNNKGFLSLKHNFGSFYKFLLEYYVKSLKQLPKITETEKKENTFDQIKSILKVYKQLIDLSKNRLFKEINLMNVFKNTKMFFEMFIKNGMPWFDQVFELNKDDCINNIKILQNLLLYLQEMSYKKAHLSKQIPQLMKLIESFQIRVKLMLYLNRCDNAFLASLHLGELGNDSKKTAKKKPVSKSCNTKNKKKNDEEVESEESDDNDEEDDGEGDENEDGGDESEAVDE